MAMSMSMHGQCMELYGDREPLLQQSTYMTEASVLISTDYLSVADSILISTDCLSVDSISLIVRSQTDEFGTDFNGLPVRRCFDIDFNALSVRQYPPRLVDTKLDRRVLK